MNKNPKSNESEDIEFQVKLFEPKYFDVVVDFAASLPVEDLLFLPRDVRNMKNADQWMKSIENRSIVTFVAFEGEKIVGAGAIVRKLRGWSSHVAEIRIRIRDNYFNRGIARLLLKHCFAEAIEAGAEKLVARITSQKKLAIGVYRSFGFEHEATLRNQIRDNNGALQDLIIYSYHVPIADGNALGYSEIY
jgi:RimJ/RimL family protein N-acetyltransferase